MGRKSKVQHRNLIIEVTHHALGGGFTRTVTWTENGMIKAREVSSYAVGRGLIDMVEDHRQELEHWVIASTENASLSLF